MDKTKILSYSKFGFIVFIIGMLCGISLMLCNGCGNVEDLPLPDAGTDMVEDGVAVSSPDFMPTNTDPVQACKDIVKWLGDKVYECSNDYSQQVNFMQILFDAWDCPTTKGLRDAVELYTKCQVDIKNMTCDEFQQANVPSSCKNQLL